MRPLIATIAATVLTLSSVPAQASFVQNIFDNGGQVGTLEFTTASGTGHGGVIQANLVLAGTQFTLNDLDYVWWGIDQTSQLLTGEFWWRCPDCIPNPFYPVDGYLLQIGYEEGELRYAGYDPSGCQIIDAEEAEYCYDVARELASLARRTYVRPADAPTTILLLAPGLIGLLYQRKRREGFQPGRNVLATHLSMRALG